jgi:hypothetical protein
MKTKKNHRQGCFGLGRPEPGFHKSKFKPGFSMMTCLILMTGVAGAAVTSNAHDAHMMRA